MWLALTQQITQADSDLEHCHVIICSEGCTVFHLFLLSRSHKRTCVHSHVPKQSLVHACERYREHGTFYIWMSLTLFFFLGQLWRAWGSFLWCPRSPGSPSQRGAEQQSCTGRVLLQVYWAAEGIQWPSQPTQLHFGTCDWFLSLYMKATILHRATAA